MTAKMSMPRLSKSILGLPSLFLVALSACAVRYAPPPSTPTTAPPSVAGNPDMAGWRLLGDAWVTGQFPRQIIRVGKYEGRVARVMLVITHGNLEVGDVAIQFGNGQRWSPGLRHSFGDGSGSRAMICPATSASSGASRWSAGPCRRADACSRRSGDTVAGSGQH